ncbi:hypothetical protein [Quadrisphaera sp. DSM 44207]|uniref:hypothetical protein n=1 Tax=Quadrisphaera sp. DSM 44207 TaxID=1881057 RepID=UPI0008879861|nr:hypothetical protein [Quadrisphaera sp. DSM 44207]SDQ37889.1 hypothetical protein SAMN05428996_1470 [Quadrisphaera sp. DSM 44207]
MSKGSLEKSAVQVRVARQLAVELLEHFGVEDTSVLTNGGVLDELGAAAADQQLVYWHARALGLPVDPVSPARRRRRYEELLAQARAALRR